MQTHKRHNINKLDDPLLDVSIERVTTPRRLMKSASYCWGGCVARPHLAPQATVAAGLPNQPTHCRVRWTRGMSLNISFQLCKSDSPTFRANLQRIEDEVEKIAVWMESLSRSLKIYLDEVLSSPPRLHPLHSSTILGHSESSSHLSSKVSELTAGCDLVGRRTRIFNE